ncbi:hypothetical protein GOBAR_DD28658 [Gossypium barbadense]|nr:hypothetical protein GOBAR_DD28658 [Gossypium barbadense]
MMRENENHNPKLLYSVVVLTTYKPVIKENSIAKGPKGLPFTSWSMSGPPVAVNLQFSRGHQHPNHRDLEQLDQHHHARAFEAKGQRCSTLCSILARMNKNEVEKASNQAK